MAEEGCKVTLNVYDLSNGLARQLSTSFLGKPIEAIWSVLLPFFLDLLNLANLASRRVICD